MKKTILALLAVAASGSVLADVQPYATIVSAQGPSTISVGNQLVNATSGMKLTQGAQLLTTATSAMTVSFAGGCTATIKAGQALNVELAACKSFVASNLNNIGTGAAAGGVVAGVSAAGGVSTAVAVAAVAAAAGVTIAVVNEVSSDPRYTSVALGNGNFRVTDSKNPGKFAIVSANGTVLSAN